MDDSTMSPLTYEAAKARQTSWKQPDKIHWNGMGEMTFRDSPYRYLHHQKGLIGKFHVRLLEGADLKRSYWSALALGPVKHLGLSKAHGPISSYVTFGLSHQENNQFHYKEPPITTTPTIVSSEDWDKKPSASSSGKTKTTSTSTIPGWSPQDNTATVQSPVIADNDNPVWNACEFELPLCKSVMKHDGMRIVLQLRVDEDGTAAENMIPIVGNAGDDARLLGTGQLDITSLCLGCCSDGKNASEQVGVMDVWIPITMPNNNKDNNIQVDDYDFDPSSKNKNNHGSSSSQDDIIICKQKAASSSSFRMTGQVRVLVSYKPNGVDPIHNDVVALETFARQSLKHASCRPLMPPLHPMRVMEVRGSYLLVEYTLNQNTTTQSSSNRSTTTTTMMMMGTMRLHRNAVFVIERTNFVDGAINLALMPTDMILSTRFGQGVSTVTSPLVSAAGDLIMPMVLTTKLIWCAVRTTGFAALSGVSAAAHAVQYNFTQEQDRRRREASFHASPMMKRSSSSSSMVASV